jgi:nitrate/nitrite transporter NarK
MVRLLSVRVSRSGRRQTVFSKADPNTGLIFALLAFAAGFIVRPFGALVFGRLGDMIGRKYTFLVTILIMGLSTFVVDLLPNYDAIGIAAPVILIILRLLQVVTADPDDCQFQFNPTGTKKFESSCDIVKAKLVAASVNYSNVAAPAGTIASVKIGDKVLTSFDARTLTKAEADHRNKSFSKDLAEAIQIAGYPAKADPARINKPMVVLLIFILVLYVTMAYGATAAMLVEMFPTKIPYSSISLPYHVGTGWFGGLLPTSAFAMVAYQGDIYYGLWYPIVIALATVVVGAIFLKETKDVDLNEQLEGSQRSGESIGKRPHEAKAGYVSKTQN